MRICSPHCGISPESGSGGEVYERELLKDLAGLGAECAVLLAAGKPHPERVPGLVVHPVWPPKGLRWYVTPFVWPRYIKRLWDTEPFDLLRAHSVRFVGPAALWARRRYRLPVPVVTHHHHLDPSPLNPVLERRVLAASDCVVTDSEFARRQLQAELGLGTDHVRVVYCGVGPEYAPGPRDAALARRWRLDGRRVLLSMGPLIARKNPLFLVEAFAEIQRASSQLRLRGLGHYWRDLRVGNVRLLPLLVAISVRLFNGIQWRLGGSIWPVLEPMNSDSSPHQNLGLRPGQMVRVKSKHAIAATLNRNSRNRGLGFGEDMIFYCGGSYRVAACINRIVHEGTGELLLLKTPSILLEGVTAIGGSILNPQNEFYFCREIWLDPEPAAEVSPGDRASPTAIN